jgi:hypothetical protein
VKLRLLGTADECETALAVLRAHLDVIDVSRPYPGRGDSRQVRVYVEARIPARTDERTTR